MSFLRLILIGLLLLMVRRIYLSATAGRRARRERDRVRSASGAQRDLDKEPKDLGDLTQQDISDADFEEIP